MPESSSLSRRSFLTTSAASIVATLAQSLPAQQPAASPRLFSAKWVKAGTGKYWWAAGMNQQQVNRFINVTHRGHRLIHLNGTAQNNQASYCAILDQGNSGAWHWEEKLSQADLNTIVNETHRGKALQLFNGYELNGKLYYTVLLRDRPGPRFFWQEKLDQAGVKQFIDVQHKGAKLRHLYGYTVGGVPHWDVLMTEEAGQTFSWEEGLSQVALNHFVNVTHKNGTLMQFNGYRDPHLKFSVFVDATPSPLLHWEEARTFPQLLQLDRKLSRQGYRMVLLNGIPG